MDTGAARIAGGKRELNNVGLGWACAGGQGGWLDHLKLGPVTGQTFGIAGNCLAV